MATFITRVPGSGDGIRLAVKDLIDVAGVPTTAGSQVRANLAEAQAVTPAQLLQARTEQERWRVTMAAAMRGTGLLALATVPFFPAATRGRPQAGLPRTHQPGKPGGFSGIGAAGADRAAAARQPAAHRRTERGGVAACHRRDD